MLWFPTKLSALYLIEMVFVNQHDSVNRILHQISVLFALQVYTDGIYKLSCNCAREAAKFNVRLFVELSTAQMASSDKVLVIFSFIIVVLLLNKFEIIPVVFQMIWYCCTGLVAKLQHFINSIIIAFVFVVL